MICIVVVYDLCMKILLLNTLLILSSCSLFKNQSLSRDITKNTKKICLSGSGKGRLTIQNSTYVFGYESSLEEELAKWTLALDFPLRNQEIFHLDWSQSKKVKFSSTIEEKILKENKHVHPKHLDEYIQNLGNFLKEVIDMRTNRISKSNYSWKMDRKSITAQNRNNVFSAEFKQLTSEDFFGLMTIRYHFDENQSYKMDFVVRNCAQ